MTNRMSKPVECKKSNQISCSSNRPCLPLRHCVSLRTLTHALQLSLGTASTGPGQSTLETSNKFLARAKIPDGANQNLSTNSSTKRDLRSLTSCGSGARTHRGSCPLFWPKRPKGGRKDSNTFSGSGSKIRKSSRRSS